MPMKGSKATSHYILLCNNMNNIYMCVGEQIARCEGECELVMQVFLEDCHIAETLETLNIPERQIFLDRILLFNCSDPETYLMQTVPVDNSSCLSTAFLLDSRKYHECPY